MIQYSPAIWSTHSSSGIPNGWVKPVLVAQVKFTEWTSDGQLRQPVFLGMRSEKEANDVVRE
jgi:ATP-dependent DNA ligase